MPLFDDVHRRLLANGLEILVREDHSAPVVALNFFVRVGSLNEDPAIAGWSHGIEHMLFKGTERRGPGDIAREIQNAGGDTNAGTGYESTNYYIVVPSANFATALDIHADVLRRSTFGEGELESEREVLIKENEMYRDQPRGYGYTWEELLADAFTTHRYRYPIGGPDENLLQVERDAILAYKERYYVPDNITYVVVGDVDPQTVFAAMEEHFGDWRARPVVHDRSPVEPSQMRLRYREMENEVERCYVKIGFHVPHELHPDTEALTVLAHILGSGRTSRLYQRVREEKGLILDCDILEATGRDPGYLVVEFSCEPGKLDAAHTAVMEQILRFQVDPVSSAELERTLHAVRADTLHTLETMEGQASMLGHYALLGDFSLAGTYLDRLNRLDASRLLDVARRYLNLEQSTTLALSPRGSRPASPDTGTVYNRLRTELAPALSPGRVAANGASRQTPLPQASGRPRGEVEVVDLPGGTRLLLQEDGRLPVVALAAYVPLGSGGEGPGHEGLSRLTQVCMLKGAGGLTANGLADRLEDLGARLRPFASRDVSGYSLGVLREDLDPALDLFSTVLTRPDFPEEAVDRERERALSELASLGDHTLEYTVSRFTGLMFPGHAYGRPVIGTAEALASHRAADLRAWHRELYDPSRLVVSVVGDFDRAMILDRLQGLVEALPAGGATRVTPAVTPIGAPATETVYRDVSQAVLVLGYPGPRALSPERYVVDVWNAVLNGMGNRLFARLRDEKHLCYFTGSFNFSFAAGGTLGAYVGTGPEQVDEAREALIQELELTTRELVGEEELRRAKNTLAGGALIEMQTRMAWAATYARDEAMGLGYDETLRYLEGIAAVTAEQIREVAAGIIDSGRLSVAVLRPQPEPVVAAEEA